MSVERGIGERASEVGILATGVGLAVLVQMLLC